MINNFWEEMYMGNEVIEFHEKLLETYNIPEWARINCPYCNTKFSLHSIREIGFKLNSRNVGDVFFEFCCDNCSKMNTFYYRSQIKESKDFIGFINGEKVPSVEPVIEEDMYKLKYNNCFEKFIESKQVK